MAEQGFCSAFRDLKQDSVHVDCAARNHLATFQDFLRHAERCPHCLARKALEESRVEHVHACDECRVYAERHPYWGRRFGLVDPLDPKTPGFRNKA